MTATRPRAIDLVRSDGATMLGIYEIVGKTCKLALADGNMPRPKELGKNKVSLPRMRWLRSSKSGTRFLVPGVV